MITLSLSACADGLFTLKSALTLVPGLALSRIGRGEIEAAKPGVETDWAKTGESELKTMSTIANKLNPDLHFISLSI
jgi:hypothetical protein